MRAGVLVTGVLGPRTALVFAAAALTASMFPNGTVVQTTLGRRLGRPMIDGGWGGRRRLGPGAEPIPMPMASRTG